MTQLNPYAELMPKPTSVDDREAIQALRQFAEAMQDYVGRNVDVTVTVSVHQEDKASNKARVLISIYVPKTDYGNIILIARCEGASGYPAKIDPYFASGSFPNGMSPCNDKSELDAALKQFAESPEVLDLLEYMQRQAQPKK